MEVRMGNLGGTQKQLLSMGKLKEAKVQMQLIWPGMSKTTRRASLSTQVISGRLRKT